MRKILLQLYQGEYHELSGSGMSRSPSLSEGRNTGVRRLTQRNEDGGKPPASVLGEDSFLNQAKGFTLIELLVYLGVFLLIFSTIVSVLVWTLQINAKLKAKRESLDAARRAVEIMQGEIKHASQVYLPTSQLDISPGQLSLETFKELPADETSTFVDFYLDDGKIYLKREGTSSVPITPESARVTSLVFMKLKSLLNPDAPESIRIGLEVEYNTASARAQWQSKTAFLSAASTLRPK